MFLAGFVFLLASAVAVALAQFTSSLLAPWASISLSVVAVACTVAALLMRRRG